MASRVLPADCAADVNAGEATFVFPEVPEREWPVGQVGTTVEYYWEVSWPATGLSGLPWRELAVVVRRDSLSTADTLPLAQLIARGSLEVVDEHTREVGDMAITVETEAGFGTGVANNRVLFHLRGGETVRRYLRARPDSAEFTIQLLGEEEERTCHTRVRYP